MVLNLQIIRMSCMGHDVKVKYSVMYFVKVSVKNHTCLEQHKKLFQIHIFIHIVEGKLFFFLQKEMAIAFSSIKCLCQWVAHFFCTRVWLIGKEPYKLKDFTSQSPAFIPKNQKYT